MAKLTVQAAPFSQPISLKWAPTPLTVSLSVSDDAGNPVDGLKDSEFSITRLQMPMVGQGLQMDAVIADTVHLTGGFYSVQMAPFAPNPVWEPGRYVVGLTVKDKKVDSSPRRPGSPPIQAPEFTTDNGQALVAWDIT